MDTLVLALQAVTIAMVAVLAGMVYRQGARIDDLDTRLTGRIDELDARLTGRIDELDARLTGRFDALNGRMDTLMGQLTRHLAEH